MLQLQVTQKSYFFCVFGDSLLFEAVICNAFLEKLLQAKKKSNLVTVTFGLFTKVARYSYKLPRKVTF